MEKNGISCSKCGQAAQFKCERCLEPYCSSQCQVSDWQDHKSKCYKFPDLIPINILKSVSSNLHLDRIGGNQRRHYGSSHNLDESRRSYTAVGISSGKMKPKILLNNDDFNMVPKSISATSMSLVKPVSVKPTTWRDAFPPSEGFFDAIVQFKEEMENGKHIVWVTDLKYDASLRKLLAEINRTINKKNPCSIDDVHEGALVAAPLDGMLYRAEILETSSDVQKATVRLIDYGNELRLAYTQLFPPIPIMCNLNAYAFRVCLPNDYGPVEIENVLTIKILGEKLSENYYNIECKVKSISPYLPIELISQQTVLKFVKCFADGRNALMRLCVGGGIDDEQLDNLLNSEQCLNYEFETLPQVGMFIAARTESGWKRARLLGLYEKHQQFLIYAIDEGFVSFSNQIKRIPESFVTQPMRVFAISTSLADCMLSEVMLSAAKRLSVHLLPTSSASIKDCKTQLLCELFDEERKIVDSITMSVFTGFINELGIKLWPESIPEGDAVIISSVLTYKEIYIASHRNNEYSNILMSEYPKCIPFASEEAIGKNDIVIYYNNEEGKPHYIRGKIIKYEGSQFKVMDIDNGSEKMVARHALRKPSIFVSSLPVRCNKVTLMFLESIPTPVANNKALEALETCMQNAVEFEVTFGENRKTVDLLFRTNEKQSLCKKLLPMVFEPATKQTLTSPVSIIPENKLSLPLNTLSESQNSAVSAIQATANRAESLDLASSKEKIFTVEELEILPITCGEKIPLYVLDPSTILKIDNPYITAADYSNKELLAQMELNLKEVADYCKSNKALRNGYTPKKLELCLSVFADDGEWYRAICLEPKGNDVFVVMFVDYGNVAKVNKKDIMPMMQNFLFPSTANMVYVEGISNKEHGLAFIKAVQKNPLIYADVKFNDETYFAKICI